MIRLAVVLSLFVTACTANTRKQPGDIVVLYPPARDSFLVRVRDLAGEATAKDTIHFIYYSDGSLRSGKEIEEMIAREKAGLLQKNYVFVGIAHFGHYRSKRRRDFISPSVKTSTGYIGLNENYGQAESFYHFLSDSIIPQAEKKYAGYPIQRSFIGHSLGGLFAAYLFVNGDSLFSSVYALSPSLWIDNYHILQYESMQQEKIKELKKTLWISCGSAETLNRIKSGVDRMEDSLEKRNYPGIRYYVEVYQGKTHNSAVYPALIDIFEGFLKTDH